MEYTKGILKLEFLMTYGLAILIVLLIFSAATFQNAPAKENVPPEKSLFGNLISAFAAITAPVKNAIIPDVKRPELPLKPPVLKTNIYIMEGKMVKLIGGWPNVTILSRNTGVPMSEIRTAARETSSGIEVPFNKYVDWITRRNNQDAKVFFIATSGERSGKISVTLTENGTFRVANSKAGTYYIATVFYQKRTRNEVGRNYWDYKLNNGPLAVEINLERASRSANNKIGIYDESLVQPIPEPVEFS